MKPAQKLKRFFKSYFWEILLFSTWGVYFVALFSRILTFEADGVWGGHQNVWSDWSLHIGMANIFATKPPSLWFAYHPMYAQGKMTYTFLTNLISGLLMRMGVPLTSAFIWPSIVYSLLFLWGLFVLIQRLTRSKPIAYTAITLFFFSAGLGFIHFIHDFIQKPSLRTLLEPPQQYGRIDEQGWYGSHFITSILSPQRSALLGMFFGVWAFNWVFEAMESKKPRSKAQQRLLFAAGFLCGLLPITHAHSLVVLAVILGGYCLYQYKRWREWLIFALTTVILGGALYGFFIAGGIQNPNFVSIVWGYSAHSFWGWVLFWLRVFGLATPMAAVCLFLARHRLNRPALFFSVGSFSIFAICNIVQFQPIQWDQTKLLIWSYLGFSILCAWGLHELWKWKNSWGAASKVAAGFLCFLLTFTGALDGLLLQETYRTRYQMIDRSHLELALQTRARTGPLERFLTDPAHNHWVMMFAARPIIMGFTAWVWNYGFNYRETELEVPIMFQGGPQAEALLRKYKVSYVVIGDGERYNYKPNEAYFAQNFPLFIGNENTRVYDVRRLQESNPHQ